CHHWKVPLPDDIMAYLDHAAGELLDGLGTGKAAPVKPDKAPDFVMRALRMKRQAFRDARRDAQDIVLAIAADTEPKQYLLAEEKGMSPGELSKRTKRFRGRW